MALVVFDLDGTLIDSVPDLAAALNGVFEAEGLAPFDLGEVTSFVGKGLPHLVKCAMERRGLDLADHGALAARVLAAYEADSSSRTRLYPNLRPALEALIARGHRLGLCTNKPEGPTRLILQQLDLARYFTAVQGGVAGQMKPDPQPLYQVIAAMGGGRALFVGDSEVDCEIAQAAGIGFVLFTEGYRKKSLDALPHLARFNDFKDLPEIVERMLAESRF